MWTGVKGQGPKKQKHIRGTVGSLVKLESDHRMFISRMTGTRPIS